MKSGRITWAVIALMAVAVAYYFLRSPIPSQQSVVGVRGMVTIGPTCPVQRIPPDPDCDDRPYGAGFNISDAYGRVVSKISSGVDGKFEINLSPGKYVITPISAGVLPRASEQGFEVPQSGFIEIVIQFDSGIR